MESESTAPLVSRPEPTSQESQETDTRDPFLKPSLDTPIFKKPTILIGKKGGGKIKSLSASSKDHTEGSVAIEEKPNQSEEIKPKKRNDDKPVESEVKLCDVKTPPLANIPYSEPSWGGIPHVKFFVEELKSGQIVNTIDLSARSFYCVGRERNTHLNLLHPTVSRYHAILQYKSTFDEKDPSRGFYVYDLGSTHGTFLNRSKIKPKMYVRMHVGHMLSFGSSTRFFILQGPSEDEEEESALSVSELKEKRLLDKERREREEVEKQMEEERKREAEEEDGVNWGMGEDAEEETDLTDNPFASTNNEELYLDDPKKTLRGWFEREGEELNYDVEDKGRAEYTCRVEMPTEAMLGHNMTAEVTVKGKKKEAVVQCALEACRMLDRYGLLRQANHESKRKRRKKMDNDDDDSDDDTFFDRTGAVEAKRAKKAETRTQGRTAGGVETYETLLAKHAELVQLISSLENKLMNMTAQASRNSASEKESDDPLEQYMKSGLTYDTTEAKIERRKLKLEIINLKKSEEQTRKLVNIAKPTSLPELKPPPPSEPAALGKQNPSSTVASTLTDNSRGMDTDEGDDSLVLRTEEERVVNRDTPLDIVKDEESSSTTLNEDETSRKKKSIQEKMELDKEEERTSSAPQSGPKVSRSKAAPGSTMDFIQRTKANRKQPNSKTKHTSEPVTLDPEDFSNTCWQPPADQTGDGRTALNDKYGY